MPKRTDIHKSPVIGSGPILIGHRCEFDYSRTQGIKAPRDHHYKPRHVTPKQATSTTDPDVDDQTDIDLCTFEHSALEASPVKKVLLEESVIGWKEYELEVMRDCKDNFLVICSIENLDPMGVHTGDSITVAPAQTLTDRQYQEMRDDAKRIISA